MTKISEAIKVIDSSSIKRKKKLEDAAEDMAIACRIDFRAGCI